MDSKTIFCILANKLELELTHYFLINQFIYTVNQSQLIDIVKYQDFKKQYLC